MGLFKNKYRIESARLNNWDYGSAGRYFITICTKNREHYFGEIQNGQMILSDIGKCAHREWVRTPLLRPDMDLLLGEFIVMPNHVHGIIIIGKNEYNSGGYNYPFLENDAVYGRDAMHRVSTINRFGPQSKNLASVMRGYKSSVTTWARKHNLPFLWQERFYDHIIRNDRAFYRISKYITLNPQNWSKDRFWNDKNC